MTVDILVKSTNTISAELGKSVGFDLGLLERTRKLFLGQGNRRSNMSKGYVSVKHVVEVNNFFIILPTI